MFRIRLLSFARLKGDRLAFSQRIQPSFVAPHRKGCLEGETKRDDCHAGY